MMMWALSPEALAETVPALEEHTLAEEALEQALAAVLAQALALALTQIHLGKTCLVFGPIFLRILYDCFGLLMYEIRHSTQQHLSFLNDMD